VDIWKQSLLNALNIEWQTSLVNRSTASSSTIASSQISRWETTSSLFLFLLVIFIFFFQICQISPVLSVLLTSIQHWSEVFWSICQTIINWQTDLVYEVNLHGWQLVLVGPVHHGDGADVQFSFLQVPLVEKLIRNKACNFLLYFPRFCYGTQITSCHQQACNTRKWRWKIVAADTGEISTKQMLRRKQQNKSAFQFVWIHPWNFGIAK